MEFNTKPRFKRALLVAVLVSVMLIGTAAAYAVTHPEIVYNIKKSITEWAFQFQQTDLVTVANEFTPLKPELPVGFVLVKEPTQSTAMQQYMKMVMGISYTTIKTRQMVWD